MVCSNPVSRYRVIAPPSIVLLIALAVGSPAAHAVTLLVDYTYDATNFFGAGNPSGSAAGAQARAALEAVADFYSEILNDTLSSIQTPPPLVSSQFNGVAFWDWSMSFSHPATGGTITLDNQTIPANQYRIYAGARNIGSLGIGGPGGIGWSYDNNGGGFSTDEIVQIESLNESFVDMVETRGESSGFARWGGAITFDAQGTAWHFDHTTPPLAGTSDFFSVAVHELGHALGLGASQEWSALADGGVFSGTAASNEYGGHPPLSGPSGSHWASGTHSRVYGTNTSQEAAMDPEVTTGKRKRLTALDAAALADIGWTVEPPPSTNPADFNGDYYVNGADLAVWRAAFKLNANGSADGDADTDGNDLIVWQRHLSAGSAWPIANPAFAAIPEPAACWLAAAAGAALLRVRRERCRA